jgi:hypothetical protein
MSTRRTHNDDNSKHHKTMSRTAKANHRFTTEHLTPDQIRAILEINDPLKRKVEALVTKHGKFGFDLLAVVEAHLAKSFAR